MLDKVTFDFNVPEIVELKYPEGKPVDGRFGPQVYYSLADGRCMYVEPVVAQQIARLGVQPGDAVEILKRQVKHGRAKGVEWVVQMAGEAPAAGTRPQPPALAPGHGETKEPEQQAHGSALEQQLQQSVVHVQQQKAAASQHNMAQNNIAQILGPSAGALFELAGFAAVDAAAKVAAYAQKQGLVIAFGAEDVRCLWNSFYINAQKAVAGGSQWRN